MVCTATCILAGALLGGFGLTSFLAAQANRRGNTLKASLTAEQAAKYQEITLERKKLATQGLLIGILLAVAYLIFVSGPYRNGTGSGEGGAAWIGAACNAIAISLATTYFYYTLSPKSDNMVKYLQPQQIPTYLEKNRAYQLRWTGGLLLGGAAAYFLGQGLKKK